MRRASLRIAAVLAALCLGPAAARAEEPWPLPEPGACAPEDGLRGWPLGEDAGPVPFRPGDTLSHEQQQLLEAFLPPAVWEQREKFFFAGMQLVIGPCFADYGPPAFFREATRSSAGKAELLENGGLAGHGAGLPFPPDSIARDDPQAGLRWAWNAELRYQGAGFRGRFRISDMLGRRGRAEPFEGEIFKALLAFRADRPEDGYRAPGASDEHWVAGGLFEEPQPAREYAWRQYRSLEHLEEEGRSDDLHAYLPNWRRVRRLPAAGIEGLFLPSFSVGVVQAKTLAGPAGGFDGGSAGGGVGGVGGTQSTISPKRSGFEGLETRPLLYRWKVLGLQDVLTPLNAQRPAWPVEEGRDFGPWGLSFASDTWDLRRALVLEGVAKGERGGQQVARLVQYVDLQTLQPLYYVSYDSRGELMDVGMYVGRWSEDREGYPPWPDDAERPVRVIDPVGASFVNVSVQGSWRRESWEMVSTPLPDAKLRALLSVGQLTRRR